MVGFFRSKLNKWAEKSRTANEQMKFQIGELKTQLLRFSGIQPQQLRDCEFRVFSQYGQDGIIQYLIHRIPGIKESFVEFGVQSYAESNTRFLLQKWNWAGLIIDGGVEHLQYIKNAGISWQHDLEAVSTFLTAENINEVIGARFQGEIGILSVDVDGLDYWLLDAIEVISPQIVIVEYNSAYLDVPLTVPYNANHRWDAGASFLHVGASLAALKHWAEKRGYAFIGCDSSGTDAFFVRNDVAEFVGIKGDFVFRKSYWNITENQMTKYGDLPLVNVITNETTTVREFFSGKNLRHS